MDIKREKNTILVVGDLDIFHARDAKEAIMAYYRENPSDLVLDFSGVEFMDSTGLGVLISILKEMEDKDHRLSILHVNPRIRKIFKITELDEVFSLEESEDDHDK